MSRVVSFIISKKSDNNGLNSHVVFGQHLSKENNVSMETDNPWKTE